MFSKLAAKNPVLVLYPYSSNWLLLRLLLWLHKKKTNACNNSFKTKRHNCRCYLLSGICVICC